VAAWVIDTFQEQEASVTTMSKSATALALGFEIFWSTTENDQTKTISI
jgi:hypothetical protein